MEEFEKQQAEALQRQLVRETGADPAAIDSSRVLRLPGYRNHKYPSRPLVTVEARATAVYRPEHFPAIAPRDEREPVTRTSGGSVTRSTGARPTGKGSQSEADWAYAKRALARGEPPQEVEAAIARFRASDKSNPGYYAHLTVSKAAAELAGGTGGGASREPDAGPDR